MGICSQAKEAPITKSIEKNRMARYQRQAELFRGDVGRLADFLVRLKPVILRVLRGDHNSGMHFPSPLLNFSPSGVLTPEHLGLILLEGPDTASFLQGQLTQDVMLLPDGQARLAAYCSAKGRMLASFVVFKVSASQILLIVHNDIIESSLKRLSMFVMRAKVKLSNASLQYDISGLLGQALTQHATGLNSLNPWQVLTQEDRHFIMLHPAKTQDTTVPRALCLSPINTSLPWTGNSPLSQSDWLLAEVLAGIGGIQSITSDAFVPQMLNYESVDGVSFKKGCYPGQEVVARSQFRGTLKRRAYVFSVQHAVSVGQEVFNKEDSEQACGTVVSAAMFSLNSGWGIVSMQTAAESLSLHLGSSEGPELKLHALPYALLEDI
jgi:folate-binding protein YgfZ